MVIGILEIQLRMDGCFCLKDKRRVLRSLMDKARNLFQVAVAEVGDQDLWNVGTVGVAAVSNDPHHAESVLQSVLDLFDACADVVVEVAEKRVDRV